MSAWWTASVFDEWLRERAAAAGADAARPARSSASSATPDGVAVVHYAPKDGARRCERARARGDRRRRRQVRGGPAMRARAPSASATSSPTTRSSARPPADRRYDPARCDVYYQGRAVARFLRLGVPARRDDERRHRLGAEGVRPAPGGGARCARRPGSTALRDHPPRGRADPAAADAALGQRARRGAGRRRGRRGGAGLGRGHLLRHAGRPAGGRGGRAAARHRRRARAAAPRASGS